MRRVLVDDVCRPGVELALCLIFMDIPCESVAIKGLKKMHLTIFLESSGSWTSRKQATNEIPRENTLIQTGWVVSLYGVCVYKCKDFAYTSCLRK